MAERYKVTVEEDNDSSLASWLVLIVLGSLCFVYVGIPLLICYLIYKIIRYIVKRRKVAKAIAHLRCPSCGKKDALRNFKDEVVYSRPKLIGAHSKNAAQQGYVRITETCTRHFERCRYCGEIHFTDTICEN